MRGNFRTSLPRTDELTRGNVNVPVVSINTPLILMVVGLHYADPHVFYRRIPSFSMMAR